MLTESLAANSRGVFERFVAAINAHDLEALRALLPADHLFIDSLGNEVTGNQAMEAGWRNYFALCPDYRVTVRKILIEQNSVVATGEAGGTIHGMSWRTPAAWQALIRGAQVAQWQVFADNKPVYEILASTVEEKP